MFRTTPDFETVCSQLGINPLEGYQAPPPAKVVKLTAAQQRRENKKYRQTFGAEPLPMVA